MGTVGHPGTPAYVDPDIGDFFVDDKGLHILGDGSSSCLPLGLTLNSWDEEGRGQEDKLKPLLGTVQEHGPGTGRTREEAARDLSCWQGTQGLALLESAHGQPGQGTQSLDRLNETLVTMIHMAEAWNSILKWDSWVLVFGF